MAKQLENIEIWPKGVTVTYEPSSFLSAVKKYEKGN